MTIERVISMVDGTKPNAFTSKDKTQWVSELEGMIAAEVFLWPPSEIAQVEYSWPADKKSELLVIHPHDNIYALWLRAQIDNANGETDKYINSMQMYNEAFGAFVRWFAGLYEPAQGYERRY